jgi:hypothetical protein
MRFFWRADRQHSGSRVYGHAAWIVELQSLQQTRGPRYTVYQQLATSSSSVSACRNLTELQARVCHVTQLLSGWACVWPGNHDRQRLELDPPVTCL